MSAIDDDMARFMDSVVGLRWNIEDDEKWMRDYEEKRMGYPAWETRDGRQLRVYEIDDAHLGNLIPFIQRKDPDNRTHWVDVFMAERRYRRMTNDIPRMKMELAVMENVIDLYM